MGFNGKLYDNIHKKRIEQCDKCRHRLDSELCWHIADCPNFKSKPVNYMPRFAALMLCGMIFGSLKPTIINPSVNTVFEAARLVISVVGFIGFIVSLFLYRGNNNETAKNAPRYDKNMRDDYENMGDKE